jgi:hypothetical protein
MLKPPGMDCLNLRRVLRLSFRQEARDHSLLHSAWYSLMVSSAEKALEDFVSSQGGAVPVSELAPLFKQRPWLSKAIGSSVRNICMESPRLEYLPRHGRVRAMLLLAPLSATAEADAIEGGGVVVYRPGGMSRSVLKTQLRQQPRPWPAGFNPRRRADRRAQAREWLQDFLEVFGSRSRCKADDLLKASRQWPANDEHHPEQAHMPQHGAKAGGCSTAASEGFGAKACVCFCTAHDGWSSEAMLATTRQQHVNRAFAGPGGQAACRLPQHGSPWPRGAMLGLVAPAIFDCVLLLTIRLGWQGLAARSFAFFLSCQVTRLWLRMLEQVFALDSHIAQCREWMCFVMSELLPLHFSIPEAVCLICVNCGLLSARRC